MSQTPKYKLSKEWKLGCVKTEKICFLPHGDLETDERERLVVTYPLAEMIIEGDFPNTSIGTMFIQDSSMVFCNFKPSYPSKSISIDLMALSGRCEVMIIESKLRRKSDGKKDSTALKRLSSAANQLLRYAKGFRALANKFRENNSYAIWANIHHNLYSKIHEFPSLSQTIKMSLNLVSPDDQHKYINNINDLIADGQVHYSLAFNGPPDYDPIKGTSVSGYEEIDDNLVIEAVAEGWDNSVGKLSLFMVDQNKKEVRLIE